MDSARVDLRFPKDIKQALKVLSKKQGVTFTRLVVVAVCEKYGLVHPKIMPVVKAPVRVKRPRSDYACFGKYRASSGICKYCANREACAIITV